MYSQRLTIRLLRMAPTLILAALALLTVWNLYAYYTYSPQTRDGKVRADVIALAADVSGQIDEVMVRDNQRVRRGQILFTIDRARLTNAVASAEAELADATARADAAGREYLHYQRLGDAVSRQDQDNQMSVNQEAIAERQRSQAALERARIDLVRSTVRAPANGIITNFSLRPGSYAMAGQPLMALIDEDSYYVAGYFEETKLARMREGMPAIVHIMGEARPLKGHVESISAGIEDSERVTASGTLLANVNPTYNWIRLAQRIPVRIALDDVPPDIHLIAGRTASVVLDETIKPLQ